MRARTQAGLLTVPRSCTMLLMAVNVAVFLWCLQAGGSARIPPRLLFEAGALYPGVLAKGEYWRFVAAGFLHANPAHLLTNMICLGLWGGHLERRVGPAIFLLIYAAALVGGNVASLFLHHGPFLSIGASGAVAGVLGALFCLWVLGKSELTAGFFVGNIGLNIALSFGAGGIDWAAHLGGFTAGLLAAAALDLAGRVNPLMLRCRFPEFARLNLLALLAVGVALAGGLADSSMRALAIGIIVVLWLVVTKIVDLLLSQRHGAAGAVVLFALANGAAAFTAAPSVGSVACAGSLLPAGSAPFLAMLCKYRDFMPSALAVAMLALTFVALAAPLLHGLRDAGFAAEGFKAARRRDGGI